MNEDAPVNSALAMAAELRCLLLTSSLENVHVLNIKKTASTMVVLKRVVNLSLAFYLIEKEKWLKN